eukprot:COSAG01_NODE_1805_length_9192_cov_13.807324_1_plen_23_part_10
MWPNQQSRTEPASVAPATTDAMT